MSLLIKSKSEWVKSRPVLIASHFYMLLHLFVVVVLFVRPSRSELADAVAVLLCEPGGHNNAKIQTTRTRQLNLCADANTMLKLNC